MIWLPRRNQLISRAKIRTTATTVMISIRLRRRTPRLFTPARGFSVMRMRVRIPFGISTLTVVLLTMPTKARLISLAVIPIGAYRGILAFPFAISSQRIQACNQEDYKLGPPSIFRRARGLKLSRNPSNTWVRRITRSLLRKGTQSFCAIYRGTNAIYSSETWLLKV